MNKALSGKNIVLVGSFNTLQFDKFFFIKNGIVREEDILPNSLFSPNGIQILTPEFNIIVVPNQIVFTQINLLSDSIKELSLLFIKATNISATAIGINFTWSIYAKNSLEEESKAYFMNDKNPMFSANFGVADALFGAYISKNIGNGRLKLDIKPNMIVNPSISTPIKVLNFMFNYHFENRADIFVEINNYTSLKLDSQNIMSTYE
jgi:hypothetical protein